MAEDCDLDELKTIVVSNIPTGVSEDDITIHFQSKRNSGDDVEKVIMLPDEHRALVTFEMANVVENVLKQQQIIKGTVVQMKLYKSGRDEEDGADNNNTVAEVFVSGFKETTTDETISLFFENKRRSGGGELTQFKRTGPNEACLTFRSPKDAGEVLKKTTELRLEGCPLRITANSESTNDKSVLIVENLNPDTSEETLRNYTEVITEKQVEKIVFGRNNKAMVYLKEETDYDRIRHCSQRLLKSSKVTVRFALLTNVIKIRKIPPSATADDINYKFANVNQGGGRIINLTLDRKHGVAEVFFEDHSVALRQGRKTHTMNGTQLIVTPYYDCFEENSVEEYSGKFAVKSDIMTFILDRNHMSKFNLKSMQFNPDAEELHVSKEFDDPENIQIFESDFKSFLDSFAMETISVPENISPKLETFLEEKRDELQDISIVANPKSQCIQLKGNKERVLKNKSFISAHIKLLEDEMKIISERFSIGIVKNKSIFLNSIRYWKKLMTEFPNVGIDDLNKDSCEIMLTATKQIVYDVKKRIAHDVQAITETSMEMSERQIEFLKRTECNVVNEAFKKNDTSAMLFLRPSKDPGSLKISQVTLMTLKIQDEINNIRNVVFELTSEECVRVDETTGRFLEKSGRMSKFKEQQSQKHGVIVLADLSEIWIVGERSKVRSAVREASMLTEANKITISTFKTTEIRARLLTSYKKKEINDIFESFSEEVVKIEYDSTGKLISVTGTDSGRKQATESLQSLSENVVSRFFEMKGPGMKRQMMKNSTADTIANIEKNNECIIERVNAQKEKPKREATAAVTKEVANDGVTPKTATSTSPYANVSIISDKEIRTKGGQKISVVTGDLSQEKTDVIVNTTNNKVDLTANPCGKALLRVGGKELEDECKKVGSLSTGMMIKTKPGKLNCKLVYHVNCAAWDEGKGEKVLRDILNKCLATIQDDTLKSIAIPAIGTGKLNFPHSVVAKIFFEEVVSFLDKNPKTTLKEARFVVYHLDQASIDAFLGEIKSLKSISLAAASKDSSDINITDFSSPKIVEGPDGHLDVLVNKNLTVQVLQGDITKESTQLIMHVTNTQLSLQGGVARSLTKVGGPVIAEECKAISQVELFSVHFTKAGKLSVSEIAHVIAPDRPTSVDLAKCLEKFFIAVAMKKIQQISFSAIGAGAIGLSEKESATLILTALCKHLANENSTLRLVRIVIFEKPKFKNFKKAVGAHLASSESSPPTTTVTSNENAAESQTCIRIHAWDASVIDKTWKEFKSRMEEHIDTKSVEDVSIKKFSDEEIKEIEQLRTVHDVEINIKKDKGFVEIRGHDKDITVVQSKIFDMVKKRMSHEHKSSSIQLPEYWDPQPKDSNGCDLKVHKVTLQATSSEYKKVADHFLKTAGSVQIQKIQRIQNPFIYKMYAQKRTSMDEKKSSNEKMLFHGTYLEVLDSINTGGLNRSFAGRNATAYGKGVYFARDASYSCQTKYSPADAQGLRYVYYGRVLVGEYTLGDSTMIVPPLKDPTNPNDKYDSVVDNTQNPGIFVLFQDYESYTEYLITFK